MVTLFKSNARGTCLLHSPANTFSFIGPRYFGSQKFRLKVLKKLTWPNARGSVGRRVQKAGAPSTAHCLIFSCFVYRSTESRTQQGFPLSSHSAVARQEIDTIL
ncbi:hypothetical protein SLEP1_g8742 [Rubroshorea leprosula]|uniref:Uncharacterized protein n=1 Tax=Rubroshorea leprosula TaxID=152421 RepID=A0AAV5IDM4_9ROSI|nr:hypothetical protein SLEP1_g8742 [Rubroshorea leprosula]